MNVKTRRTAPSSSGSTLATSQRTPARTCGSRVSFACEKHPNRAITAQNLTDSLAFHTTCGLCLQTLVWGSMIRSSEWRINIVSGPFRLLRASCKRKWENPPYNGRRARSVRSDGRSRGLFWNRSARLRHGRPSPLIPDPIRTRPSRCGRRL